MNKSLEKTQETRLCKSNGGGYLFFSILLALFALGPVLACLQLLYLAFVEHERVFGLQLAVPLAFGMFIVFMSGAYYSFLRYKKLRKIS